MSDPMLRWIPASSIAVSVLVTACGGSTPETSSIGDVKGTSFSVAVAYVQADSTTTTCNSLTPDGSPSCTTTSSPAQTLTVLLANRSDITCTSDINPANVDYLMLFVTSEIAGTYPITGSVQGTGAQLVTTNASCGKTFGGQATSGTITVAQVTESNVSGSYDVTFGSDGSFGGSFSASLCASGAAVSFSGTCVP